MTLRPLGHEDVDAVAALEVDAYEPALHESTEAFHRLIDLFPDGAIAALDGEGLCGYAFGVPLAVSLREWCEKKPRS